MQVIELVAEEDAPRLGYQELLQGHPSDISQADKAQAREDLEAAQAQLTAARSQVFLVLPLRGHHSLVTGSSSPVSSRRGGNVSAAQTQLAVRPPAAAVLAHSAPRADAHSWCSLRMLWRQPQQRRHVRRRPAWPSARQSRS